MLSISFYVIDRKRLEVKLIVQYVADKIKKRRYDRRDDELECIAREGDVRYFWKGGWNLVGDGLPEGEGDVRDHEAVHQLRDQRAPCRSQPQEIPFIACIVSVTSIEYERGREVVHLSLISLSIQRAICPTIDRLNKHYGYGIKELSIGW